MLDKKLPINLQARDYALLRGLFESRIMTAVHISTLYFEGKREAGKKRLQKLKSAGLISERRRKAYEPAILFLSRKGFQILEQHGVLNEYPTFSISTLERRANVGEMTVRHELEIMDVKAAFHTAVSKSEKFSITEFSTWPLLHQFEVSRRGYVADILVKPDGFIRIHEAEKETKGFYRDCFLEVDRSSETQDTLITRAGCYLDHYKTGGYALHNGGTRLQFKEYPFRVLIVLKSAERRNNTAERLLQHNPPILTQVWLTTFAEVTSDPLGAIWIRPTEYREVTRGTPYDTERKPQTWGYKRQPEREALVELKIKKSVLLS